jgi:hypothetical protein
MVTQIEKEIQKKDEEIQLKKLKQKGSLELIIHGLVNHKL